MTGDPLSSDDRHLVESWRGQRGLAPISAVKHLISIVDYLVTEVERLRLMDCSHVNEVAPKFEDDDSIADIYLQTGGDPT